MILNCQANLQRRGLRLSSSNGTALIIWLGVLAVLGILTALLLPALLRETDFDVARGESATLKTLGNALQSAVQHYSYIPGHTNWAQFVAAETGMDVASITSNARHQPRDLLIDTNGWFTAVGLPYTQTYAGTTNLPLNARIIIATSLGQSLPVEGGTISASSFSSLWKTADGTLPTNAPWTTWKGRPEDLKLERINLLPLFATLYLSTYASATNGAYSIGTNASLYWAPYASPQSPLPPRYYLMGTSLRLYNVGTNGSINLDSSQTLIRDGSFMYAQNVWKSSAAGGTIPGGVDIAGIVNAFLNAVPNTRAAHGAAQQRLVAQAMMNYMSNYNVWAEGNFSDASIKSYLKNNVQPNMMRTVQELFMGAYYPVNAGPCQ